MCVVSRGNHKRRSGPHLVPSLLSGLLWNRWKRTRAPGIMPCPASFIPDPVSEYCMPCYGVSPCFTNMTALLREFATPVPQPVQPPIKAKPNRRPHSKPTRHPFRVPTRPRPSSADAVLPQAQLLSEEGEKDEEIYVRKSEALIDESSNRASQEAADPAPHPVPR